MVVALWSLLLGSILECDETLMETISPEETRVVIVTTGFHPDLAKIKGKLFKLLSPPFKIYDIDTVEEQQKGLLTKRYVISGTVSHPPAVGGKKALMDRILSRREVLRGE